MTNEYRYSLKSNFVGVNRLFLTQRYYLPKGIIDNYNVIINRENFYDQAIDSHIK